MLAWLMALGAGVGPEVTGRLFWRVPWAATAGGPPSARRALNVGAANGSWGMRKTTKLHVSPWLGFFSDLGEVRTARMGAAALYSLDRPPGGDAVLEVSYAVGAQSGGVARVDPAGFAVSVGYRWPIRLGAGAAE